MKKIAITLLALTALQGCAVALVGGVAVGAATANDRRTIGAQIDDQSIEVKAYAMMAEDQELDKSTQVQVVSLNGTVLIVGQALSSKDKQKIYSMVNQIQGVKKIHNQIRVARLTSLGTKTHDTWLTTKVKSELLADDRVDGTAIKVVSEDSEVFLMGLVGPKEADVAVDITRHVGGVSRVYKAFELK
ncbi:BON domain-containing protein [Thalassotalea aquiviva]|uniref:BON domain-containing protein n=1 Tax=Thalassotalea aquiviva TaxID=3242415 RepID=UPI003529E3CB